MMLQMEPHPNLSSSPPTSTPSFSAYSSETLAQIAARVVQEFTTTDDNDHHHHWEEVKPNDDDDDDFEFAVVSGDHISSPVSADEIFSNGQIKPTYPLFDRNLLNDVVCAPETETVESRPIRRLPLRKLMLEEEEEGGETGSCSSSTSEEEEADELKGVAEGSYCVWVPPEKKKKNKDEEKKSSSMRSSSSSKRWKLRELLLLRSHSDGKKKQLMFVGPTPTKHTSSPAKGGVVISTPN